ncbi:MAG: RNA polymerase sigma factor [Spirochaetales bacterium]|nr:RNA polymerase sigma factor [Spirochaetales bacterium]
MKRFEKTYKENHQTLLKYIRSKVSNIEEAEDILQDVFFQAVKNGNALQPINNAAGWLFSIAKNRIIDWYRKKKHKTISLQENINEDITVEDLIADSGIDIGEEYIRSMVFDAIYKSIDQLPEKQRAVFLKRELKGMSFKEISQETGIPVNTLLAQKRYANLFLQKRLGKIREIIEEIQS